MAPRCSYNIAFFLGDAQTGVAWDATAGLLTGLGFCATIFAVISLFEMRSWKYIFINAGYIILYFTIIGLYWAAGNKKQYNGKNIRRI